MVLEHPSLATCKKENLMENYYQQSNPFINGLSGFDEFLVMIKSHFLHLQLPVFSLGFYYWICFASSWNGGNTGEYFVGCLNTDKCNHYIHSGIPGKALIPIYQESRDSGPNPSLVQTSLDSHRVTLRMNLMHGSWQVWVTCVYGLKGWYTVIPYANHRQ